MRFNARGRITTVPPRLLRGGVFNANGSPRIGFRRLHLASAFATADPGTRLSTAITDDGTGLNFSVTGGWSSTDPLDWPQVWWRVRDLFGRPIVPSDCWSILTLLRERTAPGLSSDLACVLGIVNESADSGTIDGQFLGWGYTAAARAGRAVSLADGAATLTTGTGGTTLRSAIPAFTKIGDRASVNARGLLDSADAAISGATWGTTNSVALGNAEPYLVLCVGRTAATAGTEAFKVDPYYLPPVPGALAA